jgi:phosphotransferase system enzyme I (PtsP)
VGTGGDAIPDRVSLLSDVAEIVSRSHDLEETLRNVTDLVAKRLDADVCSVYLVDPDLRSLTLRATIGLASEAVGTVKLEFGEGLVGITASRRETIAVERASSDPEFRYFPETGEERFESFLAAPLVMQDTTIGVLVIQTVDPRAFDRQEVELLQTCAQLLSPVVINSTLLSMVASSEEERARIMNEVAKSGIPIVAPRRDPVFTPNLALDGIPTARGVAIGPVYRFEPLDLEKLDYEPSEDPERERSDLVSALVEARRELDDARELVGERFGPEFAAVFNAQIQILEDKGFVSALERGVEESGNAFHALRGVLDAYRLTFERIEDPYFRERGADVEDVGLRVMERLIGFRHHRPQLEKDAILVVDQMLPGLFARVEVDKIGAIVSEHGGATSHGAIFARTLEIPAVTGVIGLQESAVTGQLAIVDGGAGRITLNPDEALVDEYRRAQHKYAVAAEHLDAIRERPAETLDGRRIALSANLGLLNDLRLIEQHGAEGIGLFRTELLALAHRGFPSEEEQQQLYDRVCSVMAPRPVTIRTLDLGGDKGLANIGLDDEENPQLGCRSIRLTLKNPRVFRAQLRAILRASRFGNVRLLLPMISGLNELRAAKALLDEVKVELVREGSEFDVAIPVGVMIEVPGAALIADALAKECDFFSIGTNDLTQYTLAVDRGNEHVAHLYDSLHPAVLALIARSVEAAGRAGIPVSVCGEMATNPLAVPLLIGLGISELSGAPDAVPMVKEITRALESGAVDADARLALAAGRAEEVHAIAAERLQSAGLFEHPDIGDWLRGIAQPILGGLV